jgi:hypothetical protein
LLASKPVVPTPESGGTNAWLKVEGWRADAELADLDFWKRGGFFAFVSSVGANGSGLTSAVCARAGPGSARQAASKKPAARGVAGLKGRRRCTSVSRPP